MLDLEVGDIVHWYQTPDLEGEIYCSIKITRKLEDGFVEYHYLNRKNKTYRWDTSGYTEEMLKRDNAKVIKGEVLKWE